MGEWWSAGTTAEGGRLQERVARLEDVSLRAVLADQTPERVHGDGLRRGRGRLRAVRPGDHPAILVLPLVVGHLVGVLDAPPADDLVGRLGSGIQLGQLRAGALDLARRSGAGFLAGLERRADVVGLLDQALPPLDHLLDLGQVRLSGRTVVGGGGEGRGGGQQEGEQN